MNTHAGNCPALQVSVTWLPFDLMCRFIVLQVKLFVESFTTQITPAIFKILRADTRAALAGHSCNGRWCQGWRSGNLPIPASSWEHLFEIASLNSKINKQFLA